MNYPNINQKEWPRIGKYIGELNPAEDCDLLDLPIWGESAECFWYQRRNRVYGDELPLAKNRIDFVKNLQYAQQEGYDKNIDW